MDALALLYFAIAISMDISMDIHGKSVDMDMDMDMDGKFHIHGKPGKRPNYDFCILQGSVATVLN